MNHISMPLCIVLIALMYFILREPCPCDEEDKVVEGLDWWWWVLIGWLGIGLLFLGWGVSTSSGYLKRYIKASKFNSLYIFVTVFTGAFGYLYLNKFLLRDISKVVAGSTRAAAKETAAAQGGAMIGGAAGEVLQGGSRSGQSTLPVDLSVGIEGGGVNV